MYRRHRLELLNVLPAAMMFGTVCVSAQPAGPKPLFEAASVKRPPPSGSSGFWSVRGGPGSNDPGLFRCNNCSISTLVTQAYDIQYYQLSGPDWIEGERFDVSAKVPEGATKDQFRLMLQNLLGDRFKLVVHRGVKEAQVYDLVVADGGSKLNESAAEMPRDVESNGRGDPPPRSAARGGAPETDKNGYPVVAPGCRSCITMAADGKVRMHSEKETMKDFAQMLSGQLGKPVRDATRLSGKYDIDLTFDTRVGPRNSFMPQPESGGADGNTPLGAPIDDDLGAPITAAVQSQLGLKLDSKKGQVEAIIVDHVERTPTEN